MAMNKNIFSYLRNTEHRVLRTSLFEKGDIIEFPKELLLNERSVGANGSLIMVGVEVNGYLRFVPYNTFSKFIKVENDFYRNGGTFGDYTHKFVGSEFDYLTSLCGRKVKITEKRSFNVAPIESGDVILKHIYSMDFIE